ncbi:MAG: hypothetical protein AMXMBFR55_32640 [Gemmatimonadota bacterium]
MYECIEITCMSQHDSAPKRVREPVQVYLEADDSALLSRLAEETGLSKAEILRRGLRGFATQHGSGSPMLRFVADSDASGWRTGVAAAHDEVLAESYRAKRKQRA